MTSLLANDNDCKHQDNHSNAHGQRRSQHPLCYPRLPLHLTLMRPELVMSLLMATNSCRSSCRYTSKSEEFQKPQPLLLSKKVLQCTSNLYGRTPPIRIAGPFWLLSFEKRGNQTVCLPFARQTASHLYGSTFEKVRGGWGHRKVPE